jgi:hypothetical protein
MKLLFLTLLLISCSVEHTLSNDIVNRQQLDNKIVILKTFLPVCNDYLSKDNCDDGDSMAYAGMSCLVGESIGCETAKSSIDDRGQPWRSPNRIDTDIKNGFSRDMLIGMLAYFIKTKDTDNANLFLIWLTANGNKLCIGDNRCDMTVPMWGLMYEVYTYLGLQTNDKMKNGKYYDDIGQNISAMTVTAGYRLGLVAHVVIIRKYIGTDNYLINRLPEVLLDRSPNSILFKVLKNGNTQENIDLLTSLIPNSKPDMMSEWCIDLDINYCKQTMGWDLLFVYNLLNIGILP